MENYGEEKQQIRFIDSHYKTLFQVEDGGYIVLKNKEQELLKPCHYVDAYHSRIGQEVFHICQFAELAEKNGVTYRPEKECEKRKAYWQIGGKEYLMLEQNGQDYQYAFLDRYLNERKKGIFKHAKLTMNQARNELLKKYGKDDKDLTIQSELQVLEQTILVTKERFQEKQREGAYYFLAAALDRFSAEQDPYEYQDQVADSEEHVRQIVKDLKKGQMNGYADFLTMVVDESQDRETVSSAKVLLNLLEQMKSPVRESVLEKLAHSMTKTTSEPLRRPLCQER